VAPPSLNVAQHTWPVAHVVAPHVMPASVIGVPPSLGVLLSPPPSVVAESPGLASDMLPSEPVVPSFEAPSPTEASPCGPAVVASSPPQPMSAVLSATTPDKKTKLFVMGTSANHESKSAVTAALI
jgi:hypothetical protein